MTIILDTPFSYDPGHNHPVTLFAEVKIVRFFLDSLDERVVMYLQYGDTVDGDWIGAVGIGVHEEAIYNFEGTPDGEGGWIELPSPDYDLFILGQFATSVATFLYDEVSASLEQYLIDDGRYNGTVEAPQEP